MSGRTEKQCRERYHNFDHNPEIRKRLEYEMGVIQKMVAHLLNPLGLPTITLLLNGDFREMPSSYLAFLVDYQWKT